MAARTSLTFRTPLLVVLMLLVSACSGGVQDDRSDPPDAEGDPSAAGPTGSDTPGAAGLPSPEPFFWQAPGAPPPPASIDLDEIRPGGPPPDGIPPIDDPVFVDVSAADEWLSDREPVMVVTRGEVTRAYPLQILTFHEIVNDVIDGQPTLVTYCPLCNSGLAFDPSVRGEVLDFGTSGRLWQSNLVMYDRQTRSLWAQFTGEAIVGGLLGETLPRVPVGLVAWQDFAESHPDGEVLSRDTGHRRDYGANPYVGYDGEASTPFLFDGATDDVLPQMARIVAFGGSADPTAIPLDLLSSESVVAGEVNEEPFVALWEPGTASALDTSSIAEGRDVGATGVFDPTVEGEVLSFEPSEDGFTDEQTGSRWTILGEAVEGPLRGRVLDRLPHDDTFWFVQFAFRPETRLVTAGDTG